MTLKTPLAQKALTSTSPVEIYSIPTNIGNIWEIDSVTFCNIWSDTTITYWISLVWETVNQDKQYLLYNHALKAWETFTLKLWTSLRAGDKLFWFVWSGWNIAVNVVWLQVSN